VGFVGATSSLMVGSSGGVWRLGERRRASWWWRGAWNEKHSGEPWEGTAADVKWRFGGGRDVTMVL